jgi:hypothetical protein
MLAKAGRDFSGLLVLLAASGYPDLIVGFAIGCYVL